MPRQESSRYKLSHGWLRGEDWWGDPVSANFLAIDMLLHPYIMSMTETVPPVNGLTVGDMYLVPADAVLAWSGHTNDLAVYDGAKWIFCTPTRGVRARLANPSSWIWWNGEFWVDESQGEGAPPAPIGTRYDVVLSVSFEAEPLEYLAVFAVPEAMTLPLDAIGSAARCVTPPIGLMTLQILRNGAVVGRILFGPTSVNGTVEVTANADYAAGDLFAIRVPENPPDGFENYGATVRLLLKK